MIDKDFFLNDGSQIAIIGGGPAGSFFAHFASKFAKERGINVGITIFEGKSFHQKGPRGCNMCGGVISEKLLWRIKKPGNNLSRKDAFKEKLMAIIFKHRMVI